jgi:ABC-type branched-subunit amino acid transport system ATPase component
VNAASAAPPILSVTGLSKSYGAVQAVRDVSFEIAPREVCGLIGPNGSGKSTLFDCITGLQTPNCGAVTLEGQDITGWSMSRIAHDGAMLRSFQRTVVFNSVTPVENLVIAGQMFRFPTLASTFSIGRAARGRIAALRERARELVETVGLAHVAHLPAGTLSFGQQKLLQFASMLMPSPKLILLDEPLSGINPKLIERVVDIILKANAEVGITFLVIEHNMDVMMSLCRRIIVMDQGAKLAEGSPDAIVRDKRVVEAYLGG